MDISKRIIELRENKKISPSDIADKIGIERTNYYRLEKRGDKLTIEQLKQIAGALGVELNELLGIEVQTVDNERVKELEKRVLELEKWLSDKENRLSTQTKNIQNLQKKISETLLDIIAQDVLIDGLSNEVFFNKKTKLKAELAYDEKVGMYLEKLISVDDRQELIEKIGEFEYKDIEYKVTIKNELYEKAINKFFYNSLHSDDESDYKLGKFLVILTDFDIIDDKIIKDAIAKYSDILENGYSMDEEIGEDLKIVKSKYNYDRN